MTTKKYLPLFHDYHDKYCLIVGGGAVAYRRCKNLLDYGLKVQVVATTILPDMQALLGRTKNDFIVAEFKEEHLQNPHMVIAATNNRALNAKIAALCGQKNIQVNVVDDSELCDFIFPAVIERNPLLIAVAGAGASPVLSRLLKNMINGLIPTSYGRLAALVGHYRKAVREKIGDEKMRVAFWESVLQGPVAEAVFSGKEDEAHGLLQLALNDLDKTIGAGEVYLIGAGPGDPSLLTLRAFRLIQQADVIIYDRLVSDEIMALVRPDAKKIYVGKERSFHCVPQDEINQLLVGYTQQGKRVARLKGGDPFIFGRGGEEIEQLSEHNIPFQVIPGITAASGCAAYAGIPLTHRDHAQSVRFVTGHLQDGSANLPWSQLVEMQQTVVFYMGLMGLPKICQELIEHGAEATTPAALIEKGTLAGQRVFVGDLSTLTSIAVSNDVHSPTLLIVGSVVSLHAKLAWFKPARAER